MCDICTPRRGQKEDRVTNTVEDAARYERDMAQDDPPLDDWRINPIVIPS